MAIDAIWVESFIEGGSMVVRWAKYKYAILAPPTMGLLVRDCSRCYLRTLHLDLETSISTCTIKKGSTVHHACTYSHRRRRRREDRRHAP